MQQTMKQMGKYLFSKDVIAAWLMIAFVAITVLSLSNTRHWLFNLEPYPDAIYYVQTAKTILNDHAVAFDIHLAVKPQIMPLYPLLLAGMMVFVPYVAAAVVTLNVLLALATQLVLWLWLRTHNPRFSLIQFLFFISHAVIWWLPSIPMAENLGMLLVTTTTVCLLMSRDKKSALWAMVAVLTGLLLIITKHTYVPLGFMFMGLSAFQILSKWKNSLRPIIMSAIGIVVCLVLIALLPQIITFSSHMLSGENQFFSLRFVAKNVFEYFSSMLGLPNQILWEWTSLTYPLLSVLLILYAVMKIVKNRQYSNTTVILLAMIAHAPLLLIFYHHDLRYIVTLIPLFTLLLAAVFKEPVILSKFETKNRVVLVALGIAILLGLSSQLSLLKRVVAANLLHNTRAWQYEATKELGDQLTATRVSENQTVLLFTALPPQLFEYYKPPTANVVLLPLSASQEFISKNIDVWQYGDFRMDTPIDAYIRASLASGSIVYISNAYVTHSHIVTADFETIKNTFKTTLVKTGCDGWCNLYQVY